MSAHQPTDNKHSGSDEVRFSDKFSSPDSDISYQSSDNVRFLVHKKNLIVNATGFPSPSEDSTDTTIHLPEASTILDMLFRFCYPDRHPDLMSLEFNVFAPVAEAAEKYQVFAATNICNVRMKRTLPQHAVEVMEYSARANHPELLAKTAPLLLDEPLSKILPLLPSHLVIPWVLQRERYADVLNRAIAYYHTTPGLNNPKCETYCEYCGQRHETHLGIQVLLNLQAGKGLLSALLNLDAVFDVKRSGCGPEPGVIAEWRASVQMDFQNVPVLAL